MAHIVFFAKFPPPINGQTISTERIYKQVCGRWPSTKIDISGGHREDVKGRLKYLIYLLVYSLHLIVYLYRLSRSLKRADNDTIIYSVASPSVVGHMRNLLMALVARRGKAKLVLHIHNRNITRLFTTRLVAMSAQWLFRRSLEVWVLSESLRSDLRRIEGVKATKIRVVPNTVDPEVLCSTEEVTSKISRRCQRECVRVIFVANMDIRKGWPEAVEAVKHVRKKYEIDFELDLVGEWRSTEDCRRISNYVGNGDSSWLRVHGLVSDREELRQLYLNADILLLPTKHPSEAQPLVVIEGFNAGTPAVTSRVGSLKEIIEDGRNGYGVESVTVEAIASKLGLCVPIQEWERLARGARDTFRKKFSPEVVNRRIIEGFRECVVKAREPGSWRPEGHAP